MEATISFYSIFYELIAGLIKLTGTDNQIYTDKQMTL